MGFSYNSFINYLRRHPGYIPHFFCDLCRVYWRKVLGETIIVLTTESEGLGGYLWIRNYYKLIRDFYTPKRCCIILAGMSGWSEFVSQVDANLIDVYRPFESCDQPKKMESLFFKFFTANVFINFRTILHPHLVKADKYIYGKGANILHCFYEDANNETIQQLVSLPRNFKHTLPIFPITDAARKKALEHPYVVVVERGNTQGAFSDTQLKSILTYISNMGYNIFFNGSIERVLQLNQKSVHTKIIDGYRYPIREYAYVMSHTVMVITPNTLMYHYAVQLNTPCIVVSVNEYATIKQNNPKQIAIYNPELAKSISIGKQEEYVPIPNISIPSINNKDILSAIQLLTEQYE